MTMATTTMTKAEFLAKKPAWAKAAITATYEVDQSDSMTDYFATSTEKRVFLAWSKHTKDLFSEMRKAARLLPETAHLGPGKDLYTVRVVTVDDIVTNGSAYWRGSYSPWHTDLVDRSGKTFETLAEAEAFVAAAGKPNDISFEGKTATFEWQIDRKSVEHREKYSMGAGYYLKGSGRYSSGWTVEKTTWLDGLGDPVTVAVADLAQAAAAVVVPAPTSVGAANPDPAPVVAGVTMTLNAAKNGVELRFPSKPSVAVRDSLKANGWKWSGFSGCWYRRDTPQARAFAEAMVANSQDLPVSA
jgi:hypothetical protein